MRRDGMGTENQIMGVGRKGMWAGGNGGGKIEKCIAGIQFNSYRSGISLSLRCNLLRNLQFSDNGYCLFQIATSLAVSRRELL